MAQFNPEIIVKFSEYRPCLVYGEKALFHRWIDKSVGILEFKNVHVCSKQFTKIKETFDNTNIIPDGAIIHKFIETRALVEFENGEIKEIEPTKIIFLDSPGVFKEYDFTGCNVDDDWEDK